MSRFTASLILAAHLVACAAAHDVASEDAESYTLTLTEVVEHTDATGYGNPEPLVGETLRIDLAPGLDHAVVTPLFGEPFEYEIERRADPIVLVGEATVEATGPYLGADRIELGGSIGGRVRLTGRARVTGLVDELVSYDAMVSYQAELRGRVSEDASPPEARVRSRRGSERALLLPWEPLVLELSEPVAGLPSHLDGPSGSVELSEDGEGALALRPSEGWWPQGALALDLPELVDRMGNASAFTAEVRVVESERSDEIVFDTPPGDRIDTWGSVREAATAGLGCDGCLALDVGVESSGLFTVIDGPARVVRVRFRVVSPHPSAPEHWVDTSRAVRVFAAAEGSVSPVAAFRELGTTAAVEGAEGELTAAGEWQAVELEVNAEAAVGVAVEVAAQGDRYVSVLVHSVTAVP